MSKITIIGSGVCARVFAYYSKLNKHCVTLCERAPYFDNLKQKVKNGIINVADKIECEDVVYNSIQPGCVKIDEVTGNLKKAVHGADIIFLNTAAFAQEEVFREIMPFLKDNQIIISIYGNLCSLLFKKILNESNISKNIIFGEVFPSVSILEVDSHSLIVLGKQNEFSLEIGFMTSKNINDILKQFYFKVKPLKNLFASILSNDHMIAHTPPLLLNMGVFESYTGNKDIFLNSISESTSRVMLAIDNERLKVANAYGLKLDSFIDTYNKYHNIMNREIMTIKDAFLNSILNDLKPYLTMKFPLTSKHRYITEDVPFLLTPVFEMARIANVKVPVIESMIAIASEYNNIDYFSEGRTLHSFGLKKSSLTIDQLLVQVL